MTGIVMMLFGIAILRTLGVYLVLREIRRLVELRKARLSRVHQLERHHNPHSMPRGENHALQYIDVCGS